MELLLALIIAVVIGVLAQTTGTDSRTPTPRGRSPRSSFHAQNSASGLRPGGAFFVVSGSGLPVQPATG